MSSTSPSASGFRFSDLKLANQITLIAGLLSLTFLLSLVLFSGRFTNQAMTSASELAFKEQVDGLRRAADLVYRISENQASGIAAQFEAEIGRNLRVDASRTISVQGTPTPSVELGERILNEESSALDDFTARTGAVATVFARVGDDFVRVSTSLKNSDGERVLGTLLDRTHPGYRALLDGKPFIGRARLFGTEYMTKYVPILGKDGRVTAAFFTGMDLSVTLANLYEMFRNTRFGEQGYAYVVDASDNEDFGLMLVHPSLTGERLHELVDGSGQTGTLRPLLERESGLFSYVWFDADKNGDDKFVAFDRSKPWNWVIAGGTQLSEITGPGARMERLLGVLGMVGSLFLALLLWIAISRRMKPLAHLRQVMLRLAEGDDEARSKLSSRDEVGELGAAFDRMMDERVAIQNAIKRENEQLNESVLSLLQGVAQLSRKDLTVRVPVTEDVTGAVADALNLLTSETGKVLLEVSDISADVTAASLKVKEQAETVMAAAQAERHEVEQTADALAAASVSMNQIADLARVCNEAADNAIATTQRALLTVTDTVGGINSTRDIIRETEKRIKRLGDRSQEISGVVNLINTIAERTHILALNASMHAASAGEAGRGFAVVADEVQRLAESARQATAQIATLVNSIQVETADTVNTMNAAITRVVEGSKLAEQAGEQMQNTQTSTAQLVGLVQRIAATSQDQATVSNALVERAGSIRKSSEQTSQRLEEQSVYTTNLVEYAKNLLSTVRVFKLPA